AMLLAYQEGAELIVVVGSHSNLIDFLEKGRSGMASTLLVRTKVGPILVDARGVSRLYRSRPRASYWVGLLAASLLPLGVVALLAPPVREAARLVWLQLRLWAGWCGWGTVAVVEWRTHLASLGAIFLALALGMVIGLGLGADEGWTQR